jgi:hypothetical protein
MSAAVVKAAVAARLNGLGRTSQSILSIDGDMPDAHKYRGAVVEVSHSRNGHSR